MTPASRIRFEVFKQRGIWLRYFLVAVLLPLALIPAACVAQCVYRTISVSRIQGTVSDPSGVPIPNVDVEVMKGSERIAGTRTNDQGEFSVKAVSGKYELHANSPVFAPGIACIDLGMDLMTVMRPTHLWMILDVGMTMEQCTLTTTSRRHFERTVQRFKEDSKAHATQK